MVDSRDVGKRRARHAAVGDRKLPKTIAARSTVIRFAGSPQKAARSRSCAPLACINLAVQPAWPAAAPSPDLSRPRDRRPASRTAAGRFLLGRRRGAGVRQRRGERKNVGRRPSPWRMAAIISATVSACGSAAMKARRSVPGAASTASIAANRFSSASSERRALRLPSGSGKGERASRISCAMLPLTPGPYTNAARSDTQSRSSSARPRSAASSIFHQHRSASVRPPRVRTMSAVGPHWARIEERKTKRLAPARRAARARPMSPHVEHPVVVLRYSGHLVPEPGRVDHCIHSLQRGRHVLRSGEIANHRVRGLIGTEAGRRAACAGDSRASAIPAAGVAQ